MKLDKYKASMSEDQFEAAVRALRTDWLMLGRIQRGQVRKNAMPALSATRSRIETMIGKPEMYIDADVKSVHVEIKETPNPHKKGKSDDKGGSGAGAGDVGAGAGCTVAVVHGAEHAGPADTGVGGAAGEGAGDAPPAGPDAAVLALTGGVRLRKHPRHDDNPDDTGDVDPS
jgi:hypothetical protein